MRTRASPPLCHVAIPTQSLEAGRKSLAAKFAVKCDSAAMKYAVVVTAAVNMVES